MLKGQDIVVLCGLVRHRGVPPTLQQLSDELLLTPPTIQRGLSRLIDAGLVSIDRRVLLGQAEEFLVHGLRYVFPAKLAGEARGVATSWGAPVLSADLAGVEEGGPVLVWPHPRGDRRGIALAPLHSVIPDLAFGDEFLYAIFAVLDALRSGDARLRELARSKLTRQLTGETL